MTLFIIIAIIVGGFTAYFFDVPTSLKVGENLINYWILAGLAIIVLSPILGLTRLTYHLFHKISGLFRR